MITEDEEANVLAALHDEHGIKDIRLQQMVDIIKGVMDIEPLYVEPYNSKGYYECPFCKELVYVLDIPFIDLNPTIIIKSHIKHTRDCAFKIANEL